MQTSLSVIVVIAAVIAVAIAAWYLRKSLLFSKGTYGKQTVKSILKRYALSRNYKVLENVPLNYEGKTQTEVADEISISQAQVSRLEKNALKAIRSYLNE